MKKRLFILLFLTILFTNGCATMPRQTTPITTTMPDGIYHIVGSGQTFWSIAKTYNVDIHEIMRINNINDPNQIGVGQELFIPKAKVALPVELYKPVIPETVEKLVGSKHPFSKWCYITVHHSATLEGNAEAFDRNHRSRRIGGLFYHFVIGNGTWSRDGEVEVGWRWRRQLEVNRPFDIQICLVGDFNRQQISKAQFGSLVELISILCRQYNIPLSNIRRHKDIEDRATECPGENFPFYKLLSEIKRIKR